MTSTFTPSSQRVDLTHQIPDWRVTKSSTANLNTLRSETPTSAHCPVHEVRDPEMGLMGIRNIPKVMKNELGWTKSAEVMEKWFSLKGRKMSKEEKANPSLMWGVAEDYVDRDMFPWSWLQNFEIVNTAVGKLMTNLSSDGAKDTLRRRLKSWIKENHKPDDGENFQLNRNPDPFALHIHWQFQFESVGYKLGVVDDLYGSLGNFAIYAAVSKALIERHKKTAKITVSEVALYMKDTFDFNGNQYLGHWNSKGTGINVLSGAGNQIDKEWQWPAWNPMVGWMRPVGNSNYRRYRDLTGMGGDLLLFSDVQTRPFTLSVETSL